MTLKPALLALAAAAALMSQSAAAAPLAAPSAAKTAAELSVVDQIDTRRCWWRDGRRLCRWVSNNVELNFGTPRPESFRTGSSDWWRAMDREGRGGFRR